VKIELQLISLSTTAGLTIQVFIPASIQWSTFSHIATYGPGGPTKQGLVCDSTRKDVVNLLYMGSGEYYVLYNITEVETSVVEPLAAAAGAAEEDDYERKHHSNNSDMKKNKRSKTSATSSESSLHRVTAGDFEIKHVRNEADAITSCGELSGQKLIAVDSEWVPGIEETQVVTMCADGKTVTIKCRIIFLTPQFYTFCFFFFFLFDCYS
jgi:hypothetical protein